MKVLFSVGEEVILISKNYPTLNGEYIISEIYSNGKERVEYRYSSSFEVTYLLDGIDDKAFVQSALRKNINHLTLISTS